MKPEGANFDVGLFDFDEMFDSCSNFAISNGKLTLCVVFLFIFIHINGGEEARCHLVRCVS